MSSPCLDQDGWLAVVLAPPLTTAQQAHLEACADCKGKLQRATAAVREVSQLREATEDTRGLERQILSKISAPREASGNRAWAWALAGAALVLFSVGVSLSRSAPATLAARGDGKVSPLKKAGLSYYLFGDTPSAIAAGQHLRPDAKLLVRYRNFEPETPIYFLSFLLDSRGELHWFYPAFNDVRSSPLSPVLPERREPGFLTEMVSPERPAQGPAVLVGILSQRPMSLSVLESLPLERRTVPQFRRAFPEAEVSALGIDLTP